MQRLLFCDYQRTVRYYTIYRTFKQWSSDDFMTILRLFYWRNYDYWLRLLLTSISYRAEARKELRRKPPVVPRRRARKKAQCQALEASRPRRAGMVCDVLHRLAWIYNRGTPLHPYIPYYNRAAVLTCIASGRCVSILVCAGGAAML